jgi:hypothetical protein
MPLAGLHGLSNPAQARLRPRGPAFSERVSQAEIGGGRIGRGERSAAVDIAHRLARLGDHLPPMVQSDMLPVCHDALRDQVWPAHPLELRRDLAVIKAGIVAAVVADEFKHGAAAFLTALTDESRSAPQDHGPAMLGLPACRSRAAGCGLVPHVICHVRR